MRKPGKTPPFRSATGDIVPGSIAEIGYQRLGGIDQWVLTRGESVANPPLVMLHGGPGFSETHFFRRFNAPLEKDFTVVYWDQRGAGKSFDRAIPRSSMTTEQFIADLDDLVDATRDRLGKERVAIFGHSWGTALGVLYTARFPEKVSAYVGSGQLGDWPAAETASYASALKEAERLGNRRALAALREIGPPPYSSSALWTERTWLNRLAGDLSIAKIWDLARMFVSVPELSLRDLPNLMIAFRRSLDLMWPEVSRINLAERAPELKVPVFFFLGRHDRWVPPETSVAYLDMLTAPAKELRWFEQSGHEPFVDEPEKFRAAMAELVKPVAL